MVDAFYWVTDVTIEPVWVGMDVDERLPGSKPPASAPRCKGNRHIFHLLPNNPKFTMYCQTCGYRTRKGKKQATEARTAEMPPPSKRKRK